MGSFFDGFGIGSIVDAIFGASAAEEQMDFNAEQAAKNRAFQERMSNTEIQRRRADLEKAGFNPIMAVGSLGGASSPSGSSASSGAMPSSAFQAGQMSKAQIELLEAQADKARSEAQVARAGLPYSAESALQTIRRITAETEKAIHDVEIARIQRLSDTEIQQKLQPLLIQYQDYINQMTRAGIPEAKANGEFWEMLTREAGNSGKGIEFLKKMITGMSIRGGNTYNPTTIIRR